MPEGQPARPSRTTYPGRPDRIGGRARQDRPHRLASQPLASLGDPARGRRRPLAVPASPPGQRSVSRTATFLVVDVGEQRQRHREIHHDVRREPGIGPLRLPARRGDRFITPPGPRRPARRLPTDAAADQRPHDEDAALAFARQRIRSACDSDLAARYAARSEAPPHLHVMTRFLCEQLRPSLTSTRLATATRYRHDSASRRCSTPSRL